jgi:hypothetical protein
MPVVVMEEEVEGEGAVVEEALPWAAPVPPPPREGTSIGPTAY